MEVGKTENGQSIQISNNTLKLMEQIESPKTFYLIWNVFTYLFFKERYNNFNDEMKQTLFNTDLRVYGDKKNNKTESYKRIKNCLRIYKLINKIWK